jgi:tripartite-type tricarboxylate transporter receptor subunit TctC
MTLRAAGAILLFSASFCVVAQSYPSRAVRVVVPYPAGGGIDRLARLLAPGLSSALGQPMVIENQGGGATMIGTGAVARAPADGYTLLFTSNGFAVNVLLQKSPSYKVEDFVAVAPVAAFPYVLTVTPSFPPRSVQELIDYARREPAKVNAATVGQGSAIHLLNERFEGLAGVAIADVHYRGTAPALTDLMSGQVQILFDTVGTAARQVRSGKIRALAVTSAERSALLPDVPTFREAGLPGMTQLGWQGVFAPSGTPAPIVDRLNREIVNAASASDIRARFEPDGLSPLRLTREEFAKFVREDGALWERIIKTLNIQPE